MRISAPRVVSILIRRTLPAASTDTALSGPVRSRLSRNALWPCTGSGGGREGGGDGGREEVLAAVDPQVLRGSPGGAVGVVAEHGNARGGGDRRPGGVAGGDGDTGDDLGGGVDEPGDVRAHGVPSASTVRGAWTWSASQVWLRHVGGRRANTSRARAASGPARRPARSPAVGSRRTARSSEGTGAGNGTADTGAPPGRADAAVPRSGGGRGGRGTVGQVARVGAGGVVAGGRWRSGVGCVRGVSVGRYGWFGTRRGGTGCACGTPGGGWTRARGPRYSQAVSRSWGP
ncbi:hypothetical protein EHYA_07345 [Embleya hyalina]|uniref:Uncharacterized protein n=1 Tax=Embleya hyalina TaxID=516124 RepID=A0A401YYG4_9ACTN|nr:hypothetical protein EHYA_07345 [Embleya hyalina]